MVSAIIVGLGGKASATSRSNSVKSFIKNGKQLVPYFLFHFLLYCFDFFLSSYCYYHCLDSELVLFSVELLCVTGYFL